MLPVLTQIAAGAPDGLFFPIFPDEGAHIVRQIDRIAGLEGVTLIGGSVLLVSDFFSLPESEGVYFPGPESNLTGKSGEELFGDYREKYRETPTSAYLAHAYDAATILLQAIDDVAVADGDTLFIDRAKLRGAFTATSEFSGIIGAISCDDFGDFGTGHVHISHHTNSNVTDVASLPVVYLFTP